MVKDFDCWNEQKKKLDSKIVDLYFYEREIWWCSMGLNIGFEQDGKKEKFVRPVVILKKFSKNVFLGIPLSTSDKEGLYYFKFPFQQVMSNALLSQVRLFDSKRLIDKMGKVSEEIFQEMRIRIKNLI